MILKRVVRDNITRNIYESSNILGSTYNKGTKDLVVVFKNGGQYLYNNVAETDYLRFETADSQGKVLNTHIKKYSFTKLSNADVDKIHEEIENDRKLAKKGVLDNLILNMRILIEFYDGDQPINESDIERIGLIVKEYKDI